MRKRALLILLAIVACGFAAGYWAGRRSRTSAVSSPPQAQHMAFDAKLQIPGSVDLPERSPVIRCGVARPRLFSGLGDLHVTFTNLTEGTYRITCFLYGYDPKGRRVSEYTDHFAVGRRETVIRDIYPDTQLFSPGASLEARFGKDFWIQIQVEQ
jgi:hypothetical protein